MKDYFTKAYKQSIFTRIKNFFYYRNKKFKNQLRQEISYAKFREDNPLNNISIKDYFAKKVIDIPDWEPGQKEYAKNSEVIC